MYFFDYVVLKQKSGWMEEFYGEEKWVFSDYFF